MPPKLKMFLAHLEKAEAEEIFNWLDSTGIFAVDSMIALLGDTYHLGYPHDGEN